jgi:response regulator RpfG family c-di-GMP phosphodiesterase
MIEPQQLNRGNIMAVDDNPANLKLLEGMLRQEGYQVRSFPRGRLALAAAAENPPELILLDINMPEMNGYEVCERLKADEKMARIPVIFLSVLGEPADKVKAFQAGGVDYVTKPFQLEEVQARVDTHIKLRRAQQVEHDLLEKTLTGAVRALTELAQLTAPGLAVRSEAIRSIVAHITDRMAISEAWQYELAATLSLIGCITLPDEAFEKAYGRQDLSEAEDRMFRAHPGSGARLLSNIPRLEDVAEMIRGQQMGQSTGPVGLAAQLGARMLAIAVELDRRMFRGMAFTAALQELRTMPDRFDPAMLETLGDYETPKVASELEEVWVHELRVSMILAEDVLTKDGKMTIVRKGASLTNTLIDRIGNFRKVRGVQEPIRVRLLQKSSVDQSPVPVEAGQEK